MASQALYVWNPNYLGWFRISMLPAPLEFVLGLPGLFGMSGEFLSKALVLFLLTLPSCTMFFLARHMTSHLNLQPRNLANSAQRLGAPVLAGAFYGLSPLVFNKIVDGHVFYILSYGISPLFLLAFKKAIGFGDNRTKYFILAALSLLIASVQLQFLVMLSLFMVLEVFLAKDRFRSAKVLVAIFGLTFLLGGYATIPLLANVQAISGYVSSLSPPGSPASVSWIPKPLDALTLIAYFNPYFRSSVPLEAFGLWVTSATLIIVFSVVCLFDRRMHKATLFGSGLLAISGFLTLAGNNQFLSWFYSSFYPSQLFRSVHNFLFMASFGYSLLIGATIETLRQSLSRKLYFAVLALYLVAFSVYVGPSLTGNFAGNVATFNDPQYLNDMQRFLSSQPGDFRVFYVPPSGFPAFNNSPFSEFRYGADPSVIYPPRPTLASDLVRWDNSKYFTTALERAFYEGDPRGLPKLLALSNARFVLLRSDVKHDFDPWAVAYWDQPDAYLRLEHLMVNQRDFTLLEDYGTASLWQNRELGLHIFAADELVVANDNVTILPVLARLNGLSSNSAILFSETGFDGHFMGQISPVLEEAIPMYWLPKGNVVSDILDQSQNESSWLDYVSKNQTVGQTFETGNVTRLSVLRLHAEARNLTDNSPGLTAPNAPLMVSLYDSTSKRTLITRYAIFPEVAGIHDNWSYVNAYLDADVRPFSQYYVELSSNSSQIGWALAKVHDGDYGLADYYTGGTEYVNGAATNWDLRFQTYSGADLETYRVNRGQPTSVKPQITFTRTSPVSYTVRVEADKPFILVFSEAFHRSWVASVGDKKLQNHFLVNGYANAWLVEQLGSYAITLTFETQQWYVVGGVVSITTGALWVVYLTGPLRRFKALAGYLRRFLLPRKD